MWVTAAFRPAFRLSVIVAALKQVSVSSRNISHFHSHQQTVSHGSMEVHLVPALDDNYMYILEDTTTKECAAVDPVEPGKILNEVKNRNLSLTSILTTHHHWDHAGGNKALVKEAGKLMVFGGDDRIDGLTHKVKHGDQIKVGSLDIQCLFTPCHTSGHICYFIPGPSSQQPIVFTGDTLFMGGCGRFFEGTADQMYNALVMILSRLPQHTKVYCGHEYTINNLRFAAHVEPHNEDISKTLEWAKSQRSQKQATIPSTVEQEMKINPFMRVGEQPVQTFAGKTDPIQVMAHVRKEKDNFK
ncbi:hypothetical protein ScPMuIL_015031 [Solemya velum]